MSQRTNKIIFWIGGLLIIGLLIFGLRFYVEKGKKIPVLSPEVINNYYKDCRIYLGESQILEDSQIVIPHQVFCKLEKGKVQLMPANKIDIYPGDFIIEIVDAPKFFTQEYFDSKNLNLDLQEKIILSQDKVEFCVSYGPYYKESSLVLLPNIFQSPKILNKTALACQEMNIQHLKPISVMGTIPKNTQDQPFGLAILLPNADNVSYTTLYSEFVEIK